MRVSFHDIAEQVVVVLARAALSLFLSIILGVGLYIIMIVPLVHSIWKVEEINFALVAVLTIGFGASVGSFLAWLDRDLRLSSTLLVLFLTVAFSTIGAWIGLYESRDSFKLVGETGSPALTGITAGAIVGGNIVNLLFWILKIVRRPRL